MHALENNEQLKKLLAKFINTRLGSWISDGLIVRASNFVWSARHEASDKHKEEQAVEQIACNIFSGQVVLHGLFKGMKYPVMGAYGSVLYPKLLGSYERELEPLLLDLLQNNYTEIIDIGCAEGYYAVGLALKVSTANVYAFDINSHARQQCIDMAALNGVSPRVTVKGEINSESLKSFPFTGRALVVSDCEGFEKDLFDIDAAKALSNSDVIIEAHDFADPEITPYLERVFSLTHSLTVYRSTDDIQKIREYDYLELEGLPLKIKLYFLAEKRPGIMNWLHFSPLAVS